MVYLSFRCLLYSVIESMFSNQSDLGSHPTQLCPLNHAINFLNLSLFVREISWYYPSLRVEVWITWVYEMQSVWLLLSASLKAPLSLSIGLLSYILLSAWPWPWRCCPAPAIICFLLAFLTLLRHLHLRVHYRWGRMFVLGWAWRRAVLSHADSNQLTLASCRNVLRKAVRLPWLWRLMKAAVSQVVSVMRLITFSLVKLQSRQFVFRNMTSPIRILPTLFVSPSPSSQVSMHWLCGSENEWWTH